MKTARMTALCALAAALMLAGCGDTEDTAAAGSSSAGTDTAAVSSAAETTAAETTAAAETSAETTTTVTAAETSTAPEETTTTAAAPETNIGGEGDREDNMKSLFNWMCGDWTRYDAGLDRDLYLSIVTNNTFWLEDEGEGITGEFVPAEPDEGEFYWLVSDGDKFPDKTVYCKPGDGVGKLVITDTRTEEELLYYYVGDIEPVFAGGAYDENDIVMEGADEGTYSSMNRVALKANRPVTDLRVMKLTLDSVSDDGTPLFSTEEIGSLPSLNIGSSFIVPMDFPGDTPSYGYSYIDETGALRKFAVSLSGRDGSLEVSAII